MFGGLRCRAHWGPAHGYRLSSGSSDLTDFGPYRLSSARSGQSAYSSLCPRPGRRTGARTHSKGRPGRRPASDRPRWQFGTYRLRTLQTAMFGNGAGFPSSRSGRPSPAGLASSVHLGAAARRSATPEPARGGDPQRRRTTPSELRNLQTSDLRSVLPRRFTTNPVRFDTGTSELPMFVTPELPNNEAQRFHAPQPTAERSTRSPMPPVIRTPTGVAFRRTDGSASAKGRPPT